MTGAVPVRQYVMTQTHTGSVGLGSVQIFSPGGLVTLAAGTALGAAAIHNIFHLTWPWSIGIGFFVGPTLLFLALVGVLFVAAAVSRGSAP